VKTLYVTGASSGIGAAIVSLADTGGYRVGILDREPPRYELTQNMKFVACDVTSAHSLDQAQEELNSRWPHGPDAVIHCAGVYKKSPATERDENLFDRVLSINAKGSFLVASTFGKQMTQNGHGSIVLLSSIAYLLGDYVEPGAAYASSKGAVVSLARQLAVEWGPKGVRTNVVAPGVIDTPMTTIVSDAAAYQELLKTVPLRRLGDAQEVARVCLFLAGDSASYVNGAVIPVDGGQTIV
jgi:NAD(P)-dependent dehydrogenase (short-subunit alcohol dehydrogenase family)